MKRLKYCRNYELPLFDQEQCYQFVIIDLCQLNFLLIAIYIWINGASKISGFTTAQSFEYLQFALLFILCFVKLKPDCILNLSRVKVKYSHIFFTKPRLFRPGLAVTRDAQTGVRAPGPRNKVSVCDHI